MQVIVSSTYDMSVTGSYVFDAIATVTGDGNAINDTMLQTTVDFTIISSFPHVETFETFTPGTPGVFMDG